MLPAHWFIGVLIIVAAFGIAFNETARVDAFVAPQLFDAITLTSPDIDPKSTTTDAVPWPETIAAPDGTLQS